VRLGLQRFTLIAATTRSGLLSKPFRDRFGVQERLEPYPADDLVKIALRSSSVLRCALDELAARVLAERARGTPRIVNRFLARVRDLASVEGASRIDPGVARRALEMLGVDQDGLDEVDRRILRAIAAHAGRPVGLKTIAVAVDEEEDTIEEVYEPFLIQRGLVTKTPRGRVLSREGFAKAGIAPPPEPALDVQPGLFA
jgi:Holliday junction DNA helicase RuvB